MSAALPRRALGIQRAAQTQGNIRDKRYDGYVLKTIYAALCHRAVGLQRATQPDGNILDTRDTS